MINPSDLRIGNLFRTTGGVKIVTGIMVDGESTNIYWDAKDNSKFIDSRLAAPLNVTVEWLERFGGEKPRGLAFYEIDMKKNIGQIHINPDNGMIWLRHHRNPQASFNPMSGDKYYVHQLQNLYFALTGEELTIKVLQP